MKEQITDEEKETVEMIVNDIKRYLFSENDEYTTTQHLI